MKQNISFKSTLLYLTFGVIFYLKSVNIGSPPTVDVDITSLHAKNPKDLWKKVYERVFPPEVVKLLATCLSSAKSNLCRQTTFSFA